MHASRNLSLPFDPSHNPKKRDKNRKNTPDSNESSFETRKPSLEFRETSNFQIHHSKGFRENDLFLEKHNNHSHVQRTHRPTALACTFMRS